MLIMARQHAGSAVSVWGEGSFAQAVASATSLSYDCRPLCLEGRGVRLDSRVLS
jgi:hypothetical protein